MHGPIPNPCALASRFATVVLQGDAARRLSKEYEPALPNETFSKIRLVGKQDVADQSSICRASATHTFFVTSP